MEWNWSSSGVGIPLVRVILVYYLNGAALQKHTKKFSGVFLFHSICCNSFFMYRIFDPSILKRWKIICRCTFQQIYMKFTVFLCLSIYFSPVANYPTNALISLPPIRQDCILKLFGCRGSVSRLNLYLGEEIMFNRKI